MKFTDQLFRAWDKDIASIRVAPDLRALLGELPRRLNQHMALHPKAKTHGYEMRLVRPLTVLERAACKHLGLRVKAEHDITWIGIGNFSKP